jgi:hypothetical protein
MDTTLIFSILSLLVYLFWAIYYLIDISKWKAIPHPFTWFWWTVILSINLYSLIIENNITWSVLPVSIRFLNVFIWTIIWLYLIRKIKINYYDYICLFLSLFCIVLFYYLGTSEAIFASVIVDILLLFPTIKKVYLNPLSETPTIWITTWLMPIFLLLSMKSNTFDNSFYWIIVVIENIFMTSFILYSRKGIKK